MTDEQLNAERQDDRDREIMAGNRPDIIIIGEGMKDRIWRVAHAAGCPHSGPMVPWLIKQGLLVETEAGCSFTPKASIYGYGSGGSLCSEARINPIE